MVLLVASAGLLAGFELGRHAAHRDLGMDPEAYREARASLVRAGKQIESLEAQFIEGGGYSEQLAAKRLQHRTNQKDQSDQTDRSDQTDFPPFPQCGKAMVLRTAKSGPHAGQQFLGCSGYPECKGVRDL